MASQSKLIAISQSFGIQTHRDCSINIERACQLHDVKLTLHGLLSKGLTSAE